MFRNQYCVSAEPRANGFHDFAHRRWGALHVYTHPVLEVSAGADAGRRVLIIGFIIDPWQPEAGNDDIAQSLARSTASIAQLLRRLQPMAGRFVVLFDDGKRLYCVGDACGLRRVFFARDAAGIFLTSSIKLFLDFHRFSLRVPPAAEAFMASRDYAAAESAWIGDEAPDERLGRLLPNHYLELATGQVARIPFAVEPASSEECVIETCTRLLRGVYDGLLRRYAPIQPLTAGWDSRLLLAASRRHGQEVSYYVFDRSGGGGGGAGRAPHPRQTNPARGLLVPAGSVRSS